GRAACRPGPGTGPTGGSGSRAPDRRKAGRPRLPFFPGRLYRREAKRDTAMRWVRGAVGLALIWLGACAPTAQDRVRDYNEDGLHLYRHGAYEKEAQSIEAALAMEPGVVGLVYNA